MHSVLSCAIVLLKSLKEKVQFGLEIHAKAISDVNSRSLNPTAAALWGRPGVLPVLSAKCVLRVGLDNSTTFAWSLVSVQKVGNQPLPRHLVYLALKQSLLFRPRH